MAGPQRDNLTLLQTLHLSSHSEFEGESDGEIEFTVEVSKPISRQKENCENIPLINFRRSGTSGEEEKKWVLCCEPVTII